VAAAVFGVPDDTWGQTVAAALVVDPVPPTDQAILEHFGAHLAPYKRPRRVCFVPSLPQTHAGKLDRQALASIAGPLRPLRTAGGDLA
jgi:O-succinylbenzoic acid--CoA ligase